MPQRAHSNICWQGRFIYVPWQGRKANKNCCELFGAHVSSLKTIPTARRGEPESGSPGDHHTHEHGQGPHRSRGWMDLQVWDLRECNRTHLTTGLKETDLGARNTWECEGGNRARNLVRGRRAAMFAIVVRSATGFSPSASFWAFYSVCGEIPARSAGKFRAYVSSLATIPARSRSGPSSPTVGDGRQRLSLLTECRTPIGVPDNLPGLPTTSVTHVVVRGAAQQCGEQPAGTIIAQQP